MKNKIIFVLVSVIFSLPVFSVNAYGTIYPGGSLNPLYIQIAPQPGDRLDALIQQQNQQKLLQQRQQYQQQLLDIQRQQLELQRNQQYNQKFQQQSLTNNQACPNKYGANSVWNGLYIGGGSIICDCKSGYEWNTNKTECIVPQPVQINNSKPTETSYQLPSGGGSGTVPISKTETKTKTPVVKKVLEVKESTPTITNQNIKIPATTEEKPKSFWTRLKGWFSF